MEAAAARIAALTDDQLTAALVSHGVAVGPVTASTRPLLERMLVRREVPESSNDQTQEEPRQNPSSAMAAAPASDLGVSETFSVQKPEVHVYFGVFPPDSVEVAEDPDFHKVYTDKVACLGIIKKYRGSRFKAFKTYEEALAFSEHGPECVAVQEAAGGEAGSVERPSPYRGPKSQDLVKFRKSIEKDDLDYFTKCIGENPRYLVSSGDTPAILQEGSRYNALHVAARTDKARYAAKVLSTVSQADFFQKLYPDDTLESSERRSAFLLDLYLNTPDKGLNETPLHFASKHGSLECVRVLTSYPACNKARMNKFGQTPLDIVCSRVNNSTSKVREDIQCLLGEQVYIPLFRDDDNCFLPQLGAPWSPNLDSPTSPVTQDQLLMAYKSDGSGSPLSPSFKVRGYAGPMSPTQAEMFHRRWRSTAASSPAKGRVASLRLTDQDKGLERLGRDLASSEGIPWNEYWEFMGDFANLRTEEGLAKLETYLKEKYNKMLIERGKLNAEEVAARLEEVKDAVDHTPPQKVDDTRLDDSRTSHGSHSTMSELCQELEALRLNVSISPQPDTHAFKSASSKFLENWKAKEERHQKLECGVEGGGEAASEQLSYVMKSVRVAAHRLAEVLADLAQDLQSVAVSNLSVTDAIKNKVKPEVSCLRNVVSKCYTEDLCHELDFAFIHVLLAFKTTQNLQQTLMSSDICVLADTMKVLVSHLNFITYSSDEEDTMQTDQDYESKNIASSHLNCVIRGLERSLNIAYNNSTQIEDLSSENGLKLYFTQIGECHCRWKSPDNKQPAATPAPAQPTPSRYNKAFNFLHKTLFSNTKESNPTALSKVQVKPPTQGIVKKLTFDEDGEEIVTATLSIKDSDGVEETVMKEDDAEQQEGDSFETAPSSMADSMITPDEGIKVYMHGTEASKVDVDVLAGLGDVDVDEDQYPHLAQWRHLMSCHSPAQRNSWASPYYCRTRRATSTHSDSPLSSIDTPDTRHRWNSTPRTTLFR